MGRSEVHRLERHQVMGQAARRVGRAQLARVGGVAGVAPRHQLEHQQPLLGDGEVEAGRLADDRRRRAAPLTLQLAKHRLGAVAAGLLAFDQGERHGEGQLDLGEGREGGDHRGHRRLGIVGAEPVDLAAGGQRVPGIAGPSRRGWHGVEMGVEQQHGQLAGRRRRQQQQAVAQPPRREAAPPPPALEEVRQLALLARHRADGGDRPVQRQDLGLRQHHDAPSERGAWPACGPATAAGAPVTPADVPP